MYIPENPPSPEKLPDYVYQEFLRISAILVQMMEGRMLTPRAAAPGKPREGMMACADGVNWDPGAGAGIYEFKSGNWSKL